MLRILFAFPTGPDTISTWVNFIISIVFAFLAVFICIYGKKYYKLAMCAIAFFAGMNSLQFLMDHFQLIRDIPQIYCLIISGLLGSLSIVLAYISIERAQELNGLYLAIRWMEGINYLFIFIRLEDEESKTIWLASKIAVLFYLPWYAKSKRSYEEEKVMLMYLAGSTAFWINCFEAIYFFYGSQINDECKFWILLIQIGMMVLTTNILNILQGNIETHEDYCYDLNLKQNQTITNDWRTSLQYNPKIDENEFAYDPNEKKPYTTENFQILNKIGSRDFNFMHFNEEFNELEKRSSFCLDDGSKKIDTQNIK